MKILVTGFDPFGGESINPAFEAVKLLPTTVKGAQIIKLEIPTVFEKGALKIREAIIKEKPNVVIAVGQAGGRDSISIEKVAINLKEARIPDNEGNRPFEQKIKGDGKNAYFSCLPVKEMVKNITAHGIPSSLSFTAGTYVCNEVMYSLLYMLENEFKEIIGGFIHVPYAPQQAIGKTGIVPTMSIETIAKGLEYAMEPIAENKSSAKEPMGTIE